MCDPYWDERFVRGATQLKLFIPYVQFACKPQFQITKQFETKIPSVMRREREPASLDSGTPACALIPLPCNGGFPAQATPCVLPCGSEVHSEAPSGQDFHHLPALCAVARFVLVLFIACGDVD
jgi:hypothetical protein